MEILLKSLRNFQVVHAHFLYFIHQKKHESFHIRVFIDFLIKELKS